MVDFPSSGRQKRACRHFLRVRIQLELSGAEFGQYVRKVLKDDAEADALDWRSGAFPKGFADIFGTLQSDGTQTHTLQLSRYYTNGCSRSVSE
jgi:hypothetical protein